MNKICRLIDDSTCEIYDWNKTGFLKFQTRLPLAEVHEYKFKWVLLSADLLNFGQMKFDNPNYKPAKKSFIFAHRSVLMLEDVIFTAPTYDGKSQHWSQVWSSISRIKALLGDTFTRNTKICFEYSDIFPLQNSAIWKSGNVWLEFNSGSRHLISELSERQRREAFTNLDGFKLAKSTASFANSGRPSRFDFGFLGASLLIASLSLSELVPSLQQVEQEQQFFNNKLRGSVELEVLQDRLSIGSLNSVIFNKTLGNVQLKFKSSAAYKGFKQEFGDVVAYEFSDEELEVILSGI